jgi:hypothetical protein
MRISPDEIFWRYESNVRTVMQAIFFDSERVMIPNILEQREGNLEILNGVSIL